MASRAIKVLANLMRVRKENAEPPYVLILGAGASLTSGASSFGQVIESVVDGYSVQDPGAMSWDDKVAEFYEILDGFSESERYAIIKRHTEGQRSSAGYHALAQLAREGYLEVIFSTNYDTFVEDAFADVGLRSRDFTMLINGQDTEEGIVKALGYPQPRIKLVKLHGDLDARIFAFTPEEIFQFSEKIERVLTDYLSRDVIISGHGMRDDDINRCLRGEGGSLWYVNPSAPTASDFIGRAMRVRKGTTIEGEDGYFDHFFCTLRDELVGAPVAEAAVSRVAPVETITAPPVEPPPPAPTSYLTMSDEALETEFTKLKGQVFDLEQEKGRITEPWRVDYKGKDQARLAEIQKELDGLGKMKNKLGKVVALKKRLRIRERNLDHLQRKIDMSGGDVPISVLNQIDAEKDEIAKIKMQIEELGA
ncbi:MAG: hypothetical protein E3J21_15485 [Anaerolineales bacterium]|nr:MAG: hypothetical protein E3J21_15485 [Anaerolineales bacterium]